MNPGLTEEGLKVAAGLIESLKSQPATLAMILMSFGLLGYVYYEAHSFNVGRQEMLKLFLDQQRDVQKLLANCIVPSSG